MNPSLSSAAAVTKPESALELVVALQDVGGPAHISRERGKRRVNHGCNLGQACLCLNWWAVGFKSGDVDIDYQKALHGEDHLATLERTYRFSVIYATYSIEERGRRTRRRALIAQKSCQRVSGHKRPLFELQISWQPVQFSIWWQQRCHLSLKDEPGMPDVFRQFPRVLARQIIVLCKMASGHPAQGHSLHATLKRPIQNSIASYTVGKIYDHNRLKNSDVRFTGNMNSIVLNFLTGFGWMHRLPDWGKEYIETK